ncbi:hypothetical protein LCGC14_1511940 [marine sediment metagenome]|uniref:DNA (cytosine-5-)-methyltransferase n=1 Tax=marine sediment metagenome TaxID=412755 RepID=A0A0F9LGN6_9ZZZZ
MKHGSLFTGIGGFDLGFERAAMPTVWRAETNRYSNVVIEDHWPGGTNHGDVSAIDPARLSSIDVLSGGFPCQDISVAGNRAGLAGSRSGLWWEFARIIDAVRPPWVVIENVSGLLSSSAWRDLGTILGALGDLGYGFAYRVLDAQWFGLAQRRRRVVIVGCLGDAGRAGAVLLEPEGVHRDSPPSREEGQEVAGAVTASVGKSGSSGQERLANHLVVETLRANGRREHLISHALTGAGPRLDPTVEDFVIVDEAQITSPDNRSNPQVGDPAPTLSSESRSVVIIQDAREMETKGQNGMGVVEGDVMYTLDTASRPGVLTQERVRRLTPTEWCRLQGFPDDWNAMCSDSQRYKQLGNAFPPVMAEWLGRRIVDASG